MPPNRAIVGQSLDFVTDSIRLRRCDAVLQGFLPCFPCSMVLGSALPQYSCSLARGLLSGQVNGAWQLNDVTSPSVTGRPGRNKGNCTAFPVTRILDLGMSVKRRSFLTKRLPYLHLRPYPSTPDGDKWGVFLIRAWLPSVRPGLVDF